MKVKKPILLIQDNFGGLDQNQGQNPIVHCRFVDFPPLFWAKNASKSLKMPMFPYKMDTLYAIYHATELSVQTQNDNLNKSVPALCIQPSISGATQFSKCEDILEKNAGPTNLGL